VLFAGGAIVALAVPALAACSSSGAPATVGVTSTSLGNILVDAKGRTLYLFHKDSGTTSTCAGACAAFWPPLITPGAPTNGHGANASLIGTTKRQDGKSQVTYNGHPVYLYTGDPNPGDANGEGVVAFGGGWFAVSSSGRQVSGSPPNARGGSSPGY
jgi:predicted lipoprotein with Yx(FWY)xxD motif